MTIVAVTVLTSLDGPELARVFGRPRVDPAEEVVRLAQLAEEAGAWGVVCSGQEASAVRDATGDGFGIVTPGIRLEGGDVHDQARVVTPASAVGAGATSLVVGRAVTGAADPVAALARIREEARSAATKVGT